MHNCVSYLLLMPWLLPLSPVAFTEYFIREDRREGKYCCSFLIFVFHVIVLFLLVCSGVGAITLVVARGQIFPPSGGVAFGPRVPAQ